MSTSDKPNESLHNGLDEEPLSEQDLNKIAGGEDVTHDRSLHSGVLQGSANTNSNTLEPGPTFPTPPHPEDL
ncbi:MAG: hypothetical protein KME15_06745 [Drouetiella hepatica Uher 2000/2452]|jgi:hypothetical protein|uniref:Uncharacterized protein n=1 Tax=Drouetiella hepatica Uher 2000/2452 TaxID=904376 RepID=A0A951QBK9_9CYAN|nr:hypothetical protein [Drouetiella hepatica Uher 2000/2452]